ncbi:MAG: tetratricopeptide repeat protein [Planctomycetes bacterium]|nr:tetratricopeptide repeat protein [Planctomycetota bacterium]
MIRTLVFVVLLICMPQNVCNAQTTLRDYMELFSGEKPAQINSPSVHAAAQEYIVGRQFEVANEYGFAIAHYKKAIQLDNNAYAPWVGIARSLAAMGRTKPAIAVWREVLVRNQQHGDALLVVGLDDARVGDLEQAKKWLARRRLQEEDEYVEALLRDSALLALLKKLNNYEAAQLLQDKFQNIFDLAVTSLIHQRNRENWLGVLQQLVDVGAADIAAQLTTAASPHVQNKNLCVLLTALPLLEVVASGDGSLTEKVYTEISRSQQIPLAPRWFEPVSLAEALSIAAQTMSVLGAVNAPIALYEKSIAIDPTNAMATNNMAWMKLKRDGATDEVIQLCNRAYELDPDAPYIKDTLGWLYVVKGEPTKAIPLFVEALKSNEHASPDMYNHLGDAYWQAEEFESAVRAWKTAATILHAPETKQAYVDGFKSMAYTVWGISVATPEALYDLELGEVTRNVMQKIKAFENGNYPKVGEFIQLNGVN